MVEAGESPLVLEAEGLTVVAGGRTLFKRVSFHVETGEIVLLGSPSGTGKTVLLKIISGLITPSTPDFHIEGLLEVDGENILERDVRNTARGKVGIVFQDHALLEGGTVESNLLFAYYHRTRPIRGSEAREASRKLTEEFGLDAHFKVRELSGGQRQRTALARTLAYQPRILAYDEPTSGLDPANRERVADRILATNKEHGTTSLVVTHDLSGLLHVVDRVLLINPATCTLEEVQREEALDRIYSLEIPPSLTSAKPTGIHRVRAGLAGVFSGTTRTVEGLLLALNHLIPRWKSVRWGWRFLADYLRLIAGPSALIYFLIAGFVVGFVTTYFMFRFLPYRLYTEPLILDDLIGALGFGLHRILIPLFATILLAARGAAAISADIGGRVAGHQIEAMHSLGASSRKYLLTGVLWAMILGVPLIALVAFLGSRGASLAVFAFMAPELSLHYWDQNFHRLLFEGTEWVVAKYLTCAFLIGAVSYFRGAAPKASPEDVAKEITLTIILTSLLVLAVQVVFSFFEFRSL